MERGPVELPGARPRLPWEGPAMPWERRGSGVFVEGIRPVQVTTVGGLLSLDLLTRELLEQQEGGVTVAAFSPDGRLLARGGGNGVSVRDGTESYSLPGAAQVIALAFSPDGSRLAAGCADGTAVVWDVKERKQVGQPLRVELGGIGVAFEVKDGAVVVTQVVSGAAAERQGDLKAGDRILAVSGPGGAMVSTEGATASEFARLGRGRVGAKVRLKLRRGDEEREVEVARSALGGLAVGRVVFSPDGRRLALDVLGSVAIWEPGKASAGPFVHGLSWAITFAPDGRLLAGRDGGGVVVIDPAAGREVGALPGLGGAVVDLACAHDGRLAVLTRSGREVKCHHLDVTALDDTPARFGPPGADRRQAIRDLTALIQAGKEKDKQHLARLHHQRGRLLAQQGDLAAAKRDFDTALQLDPSLEKP
jgi:WD40 repeat protein